jgi:signal transduction histidine kinase
LPQYSTCLIGHRVTGQSGVKFGLSAQLLVALLAFGAIPLVAAITVGFLVSREVVTEQAEVALRDATQRQAMHLATEIARQRLLLRTITGQLPDEAGATRSSTQLGALLRHSLPEDGVFDGLRLIGADGRILASVALRDAAPHWPERVPAADWRTTDLSIHHLDGRVVAYVLGTPAGGRGWLEGHVRAEDFGRLFAIPGHMLGGIVSAIHDRGGLPVYVADSEAAEVLRVTVSASPTDSSTLLRTDIGARAFRIAAAPVPGTSWIYVAGLPLEEALAPIARLRDAAALGTALLVALIVLTAVLAARFIGEPLRQVAAAAQQLGQSGTWQPIRHSGGNEVGLLVESFNRMADDLRQSRTEVERLHAQELERAQQLATVGELASGVAHEIRNPLTGVLGAIELAARRLPPDDTARPLLAEAERQLRRIATTTAQLLRYARPPELREVVVDAGLLVERAERVVRPRGEAAGIGIDVESAPAGAMVSVDPELMVQLLVNLMLNGIEALPRGGRLRVQLRRQDGGVVIRVVDTGAGVPVELRDKIFRPFFTSKPEGTGLGLPISRQIATGHGGSLLYEETPGGGATFVVTLPVAHSGEPRA